MENLPKAVGPYSAYRIAGDTVYISGQLGINPKTNTIDCNDVKGQVKQALENMKTLLESINLKMENVVKTTVLLDDIADFAAVNEVYATFFKEPYPARSAFEVGKLPKAGLVEIEAIAYIK